MNAARPPQMRRAVAGKACVHELAKELGVTSKEVLKKLADQGEYVKSASSTVEAPVARRLRDAYAASGPAKQDGQKAAKPSAPKAASPASAVKPGPRPTPKPAPVAEAPAPAAPKP